MPGSEPTEPQPQVTDGEEAAPGDRGADIHPEDPDDEWQRGPARRGVRVAIPTAVIVTLVAVAAGFWGGAIAEKHHNPSGGSQLASLAGRFASTRGAGGFSGAGSARAAGAAGASGRSAAAASGIVTGVQGQTLYLTGSDGSLIKVTLGPSATVDQAAPSTLGGLQTGNTAVVRGTRNPDGSVTATAIVSSPATTPPGAATPSGP
ncbi:MAG: hypothetical protein M3Y91_04050 [Actinomycetota bacterium]|nr:hypothetical protein [Actinomycetota bacterium]